MKVRRVLAHYEDQSEEAVFENTKQTTMGVPIELVPMVRELLVRIDLPSLVHQVLLKIQSGDLTISRFCHSPPEDLLEF